MQGHKENTSCDEENGLNNVAKRLYSLTSVVMNEVVNIYKNRKRPAEIDQLTKQNISLKEANKAETMDKYSKKSPRQRVVKGIFVSRDWSISVRVKCLILVPCNVICCTPVRRDGQ